MSKCLISTVTNADPLLLIVYGCVYKMCFQKQQTSDNIAFNIIFAFVAKKLLACVVGFNKSSVYDTEFGKKPGPFS